MRRRHALGDRVRAAAAMTVATAILASCAGLSSDHDEPGQGEGSRRAPAPGGPAARTGPDQADGTASGNLPTAVDEHLASGEGSVEHLGLTVSVEDEQLVAFSPAELPDDAYEDLFWLTEQGVAVTAPLSVETDATGGRLAQSFADPLPEGWTAGFITFAPSVDGWSAVEGELSSDRTVVTADVDHFSSWSTFIAFDRFGDELTHQWTRTVDGAQELARQTGRAAREFADHADYFVSDLLTVRVDPPECPGEVPDWVSEVVSISEGLNNPVHFCTGSAPESPDELVVRLRVNRGFGMTLDTSATPVSAENSTFDGVSEALLGLVTDTGGAVATGMGPTLAGSTFVGAGQEVTLVFDEAAVRDGGASTVVELMPPGVVTFSVSQLASSLVGVGLSSGDATAAAVLATTRCVSGLQQSASPRTAASEAASCALEWLLEDPEKLGLSAAVPGSVLRRTSLQLELAAAVWNSATYAPTQALDEHALRLSVFPVPERPVVDWDTATYTFDFSGIEESWTFQDGVYEQSKVLAVPPCRRTPGLLRCSSRTTTVRDGR